MIMIIHQQQHHHHPHHHLRPASTSLLSHVERNLLNTSVEVHSFSAVDGAESMVYAILRSRRSNGDDSVVMLVPIDANAPARTNHFSSLGVSIALMNHLQSIFILPSLEVSMLSTVLRCKVVIKGCDSLDDSSIGCRPDAAAPPAMARGLPWNTYDLRDIRNHFLQVRIHISHRHFLMVVVSWVFQPGPRA